MNDDELELRLRDELHRRVVAPDAPGRLYRCVDRMGLDGYDRPADGRPIRIGFRRVSRGAGILGGLAGAAGIAALLAVSLAWRPSHNPGPVAGDSATARSASSTASPVAVASPTPMPTPVPTWAGKPIVVAFIGRLDADFGWVVGSTSNRDGPQNLYLTRDGGTTWKTSTPPDIGIATSWIQFVDSDYGAYAVGKKVYVTADGGSTWTSSTVPGPSGLDVETLQMLDSRLIWAQLVANSTQLDAKGKMELWATTDGGSTWSLRLNGRSSQWPEFTFVSQDEGWGWLGTNVSGKMKDVKSVHTLDGGRTWTSAPLPLPADYHSFMAMYQPPVVSGGRMLLEVLAEATLPKTTYLDCAFILLTSDDGGASWTLSSTTPLEAPPHRVGQSGSLFWLQGSGQLPGPALTFFDPFGPASSAAIDPPTTVCQQPAVDSRQRVGSGSWYIVVSTTEAWLSCGTFVGDALELDHLYSTTDGGKTWRGLLGAT